MLEPSPEIVEKLELLNGYALARRGQYAEITEQLDKLYHDIDSGLFGESAKTGQFHAHIHNIKSSIPKPDNLDQVKAELDALIAQEPIIEPENTEE